MRNRSSLAVASLCSLMVSMLPTLPAGLDLQAQQPGSVSGTVVDDEGNPIANALVRVPASGISVITDASGNFRIAGLPAAGNVTIRITTMGFSPVTETVEVGSSGLRYQLVRAAISLDAYVVTGTAAAVQEARAVGNSVVSIAARDVTETAYTPDVSAMINARAPGVFVMPRTGQVGAGPSIRIRGASSFSLETQPLVYVDGLRLDNTAMSGFSIQSPDTRGVVNRLNDVNPEDIESIEIIKGPAAATLYGTEASNGVIQIITKRGRPGPPEVNLRMRQGANWFANAAERIDNNWGFDPALLPDDSVPVEMDIFALENERGNPPIFKTGHLQGYGASMRGGTDQVTYFVGADYDRDEGVEPNNRLWRLTTRANLTIAHDPKYDLTVNVAYGQGRTNFQGEGVLPGRMTSVVWANPQFLDSPTRGFFHAPPEIIDQWQSVWQDSERAQYGLQLNHRPWNWLSHRLTLGQDRVSEENVALAERLDEFAAFSPPAQWREGSKYRQDRDVSTTTFDYSVTATRPLGRDLRSSTTLGAQYYRSYTDLRVLEGTTFPAPGLTVVDALAQTYAGETFSENNTLGLFVQQQMALGDRIFLTGAIRGDDNSAFGRDYDFVMYPKVSATWVVSEEPFWNVGLVDALKLRAAYGQAGQQPGTFYAAQLYSAVSGAGGAAVTPAAIGNDSLGPERGTELEVGFEAGLWQSRVGIDFTYYYTRTSDAILLHQPPTSLGFPGTQYVNAGTIRNQGFEIRANALAVRSRHLEVDVMLNLATNSNKVLDLGGVDQGSGFITTGTGGFNRNVVGHPVASYFHERIVSATLVGTGPTAIATDILCDGGDPNGILLPDGTPTEPGGPPVDCSTAPRLYYGNPVPTFEGSFSVAVTLFQNLRLYGLIDWQTGHTKVDGNRLTRCLFAGMCRENYFPEEYDAVVIADLQTSGIVAQHTLVSADFAKIREVSLSWTLPTQFTAFLAAKRASLTVAGRNLHTFTGYKGLDPQAAFRGNGWEFMVFDQTLTPQLTSLVTMLSLTF